MTEVIKAEIKSALARKFKKLAMEKHKYKKGAVKIALEELIKRYVSSGEVNWKVLRGSIKSKMSSIELQHKVWRTID